MATATKQYAFFFLTALQAYHAAKSAQEAGVPFTLVGNTVTIPATECAGAGDFVLTGDGYRYGIVNRGEIVYVAENGRHLWANPSCPNLVKSVGRPQWKRAAYFTFYLIDRRCAAVVGEMAYNAGLHMTRVDDVVMVEGWDIRIGEPDIALSDGGKEMLPIAGMNAVICVGMPSGVPFWVNPKYASHVATRL